MNIDKITLCKCIGIHFSIFPPIVFHLDETFKSTLSFYFYNKLNVLSNGGKRKLQLSFDDVISLYASRLYLVTIKCKKQQHYIQIYKRKRKKGNNPQLYGIIRYCSANEELVI